MINIEPEKYYSAKAVVEMGFLPWKSRMTFTIKLSEKKWQDVFNPIIDQTRSRRRFYIKGDVIIKYIKELKNGNKK